VHEIGLQVSHGIGELGKSRLEGCDWIVFYLSIAVTWCVVG